MLVLSSRQRNMLSKAFCFLVRRNVQRMLASHSMLVLHPQKPWQAHECRCCRFAISTSTGVRHDCLFSTLMIESGTNTVVEFLGRVGLKV
uniref:Uncharacterized protein n=1 Tax=Anguilla anguilla TaxID=7936 RepID=A0A0E9XK06_ANGAN